MSSEHPYIVMSDHRNSLGDTERNHNVPATIAVYSRNQTWKDAI